MQTQYTNYIIFLDFLSRTHAYQSAKNSTVFVNWIMHFYNSLYV